MNAPTQAETTQQLSDDLRQRLRTHVAQISAGEWEAAERGLREVLAQAKQAGLASLAANVLYRLSYVAESYGDYHSAGVDLEQALALVQNPPNPEISAVCHFARGRLLMLRGRMRDAETALEESLMFAVQSGSANRQAEAYLMHSRCCRWLGRLRDAHDYLVLAIELARQAGGLDAFYLSALTLGASVARQLGLENAAQSYFDEAAGLSTIGTYTSAMCGAYAALAFDRFAQGEEAAAATALERAEAMWQDGMEYDTELALRLARAEQLDRQGGYSQATEEYLTAQRLAQRRQSRFEVARVRLERVPGLLALGALDHAHAVLLDAELAFELFDARINLTRSYCGWAEYYAVKGEAPAAEAALAQAAGLKARLEPHGGLQLAADFARARQRVHG